MLESIKNEFERRKERISYIDSKYLPRWEQLFTSFNDDQIPICRDKIPTFKDKRTYKTMKRIQELSPVLFYITCLALS